MLTYLYPDIESHALPPFILTILARLANGKADVPDLEIFDDLEFDEEGVPELDEWNWDKYKGTIEETEQSRERKELRASRLEKRRRDREQRRKTRCMQLGKKFYTDEDLMRMKEDRDRKKCEAMGQLYVPKKAKEEKGKKNPGSKLDETWVMYGKRRSGKSVFMKEMAFWLKDSIPLVKVFSRTENKNFWYHGFVPPDYIETVYTDAEMQKVLNFQEATQESEDFDERVEEDENYGKMMVILDDVIKDRHTLSMSPQLTETFTNGRHFRMMVTILLQYDKAIPPAMRNNIDIGVLFRTKAAATRKNLHELFGADIDFTIFIKLLNKYTKDHMVLICDMSQPNEVRIKRTYYWYKCHEWFVEKPPKGKYQFFFGHPELWASVPTAGKLYLRAENKIQAN